MQSTEHLEGASIIQPAPVDPVRELLELADRIDAGAQAGVLTLDAAADAIAQVGHQQMVSRRVGDIWGEVTGAVGRGGFEAGAAGTPRVTANTWMAGLKELIEVAAKFDERKARVDGDATLSRLGKDQKISELLESRAKEEDRVLGEAMGRVEKFVSARRSKLREAFPEPAPSEIDEGVRLRRAVDVTAFGVAHAALEPRPLVQLLSALAESRSPFLPAALRFACARCAGDPGMLAGVAAQLGGSARVAGVERMLERADQRKAAVEALALRRLVSRITAERGSLQKHGADAAKAFLDSWQQADLTQLLAAA
jgi:hypothetical protein